MRGALANDMIWYDMTSYFSSWLGPMVNVPCSAKSVNCRVEWSLMWLSRGIDQPLWKKSPYNRTGLQRNLQCISAQYFCIYIVRLWNVTIHILCQSFTLKTTALLNFISKATLAQAKEIKRVKRLVKLFVGSRHRATERHLPYGITQCYLPNAPRLHPIQ